MFTYTASYTDRVSKEVAETRIKAAFSEHKSIKYLGIKDGKHRFTLITKFRNTRGVYNYITREDFVHLE